MLEYFRQGGPIMYPLLVCSLVSLTLIVERALFWIREEKRRDRRLLDELMTLVEQNELEKARGLTGGTKDFVVRVMVCGIVHQAFSLRDALRMGADEEIARMRRYLPILDTMITLSPLLGILGTVTGIISSFNLLGSVGIEQPRMITAGIAQALITTAFGLLIAILSLLPYNYFLTRVEKAALEMEKYGTTLEILFEKLRNGGKP
ncbi:MAG TPA: MotA/TolQ/ExbB proton channel family protein [Syntrophales bacterium]|nr:MotA/TolQ/ExbB proton channel family protein [Syntrophales bacterium]HPX10791.1 MotA/TolQ/ExbB proton channel family protein [Syntrophales bacterium]HQB30543.1 MotA/TolQ/ExbB proton channel family protein [Syntrophales bacterium]HQN77371.1 MotA/TolQ/ExbB proton channel family protein [Syntrophales bacterium]HQQ26711.1 MotA/TolQ/ExbB proton channel family protein [Syntrophales bacterium]